MVRENEVFVWGKDGFYYSTKILTPELNFLRHWLKKHHKQKNINSPGEKRCAIVKALDAVGEVLPSQDCDSR
jgi:hypothetical protein